ncbi:MAG: ATP-binding protein, partial [Candidatus Thorarchaeota archaeon]
ARLAEGMMVAVKNFRSRSAASAKENIQSFTVMVVSRIWPLHYGLSGLDDSHYYPLQMEVIEQAVPDWDTDDESSMMIHMSAVPINYDLVIGPDGEIEFTKGFSYPLLGAKAYIVNHETVNSIYNKRVREALGFTKKFTSPDPRKDPRLGLLRMFEDPNTEIPVYVDLHKLIRYHFGVFSFTGGGKSNLISNIVRRVLFHTTDTKVVIFDISCEYPFLLCDVVADDGLRSCVVLEEEVANAEQFSCSVVKPRKFEDDPLANKALEDLYNKKRVVHYNREAGDVPSFGSLLADMMYMRDGIDRITYLEAADTIRGFVKDYMKEHNKSEKDELDENFIDELDRFSKRTMEEYAVHEKAALYAWGTTRHKMKDSLRRAREAVRTGVTVGDIVNMLKGEERLICISIAEPSILRDIVVKLTESALGLRKREFTVKPQILFVFDEAQEFIPQYVSEDLRRCSHAVERLLRQGRKYGLGGAIATQRVAHLNTNVLQQLHTFFVGTLPRPYDRSVVSNSFQIDITMMDKTLEFPPGSWLLSSYVATGLDNVPLFIRADNVEEAIGAHLKQFRGASQ